MPEKKSDTTHDKPHDSPIPAQPAPAKASVSHPPSPPAKTDEPRSHVQVQPKPEHAKSHEASLSAMDAKRHEIEGRQRMLDLAKAELDEMIRQHNLLPK